MNASPSIDFGFGEAAKTRGHPEANKTDDATNVHAQMPERESAYRSAYFGSGGSGVTLAFGGSACIVMSVIETKS